MRSLVEFKQALFVGLLFAGLAVPLNRQIFHLNSPVKRQLAHASQFETATPRPTVAEAGAVLQFHCGAAGPEKLETASSFIRVVGDDCADQKNVPEFSVRHLGDKADAQILWFDQKRFSTDLIRLKKGGNLVEVAYLENGRRKTRVFEILNSSRTDRQE